MLIVYPPISYRRSVGDAGELNLSYSSHSSDSERAWYNRLESRRDWVLTPTLVPGQNLPCKDPAFRLACGRLPESCDYLASQPTMSRWENAPDTRTLVRLSHAMVDLWYKSYARSPKAIILDIDDTADTVHDHQHRHLSQTPNCHCSTRISTNAVSCRPCLRCRQRPLPAG
jgi:Transposase DDE domain group 1